MDEVTGLLRDVELEIKEQYVFDIENQVSQERKAILDGADSEMFGGPGIYLTQIPGQEELKELIIS